MLDACNKLCFSNIEVDTHKNFFSTFACFSGVATCIWCLFCSDLVTLAYISHKTEVLLFVILEIKSNTDRFLVLCKKYVNAFSTWRIRKLVGHCPFFSNFFFFLSTLYREETIWQPFQLFIGISKKNCPIQNIIIITKILLCMYVFISRYIVELEVSSLVERVVTTKKEVIVLYFLNHWRKCWIFQAVFH